MKMSKEAQKILVSEGFRFITNDIDKAMITGVVLLQMELEKSIA